MVSRSFWARACLCALLGAGVALGGCEPLYGAKPERLPQPQKKAHKEEPDLGPQIKDVEECQADFHGDPKSVRQQTQLSSQLTTDGETAMAKAEQAGDPATQLALLKEGIDKYRNALLKDPYNAEATLKLALAYDRVYRKGCAIAMLKRLSSLTANPRFFKAANAAIDSIGDNAGWFKRYRKEANAAVGR